MGLFLSIDTGGTHTDIVAIDQRRRQLVTHKVPTTPGEPARGVLAGIRSALQRIGATFADVQRLVYGTTLVTNILLERKSVPVALITTENFRDVLAMGRAYRLENIYDLNWRPAPPLVPRYLRLGVTERIDAKGNIVTPLDEDSVRKALSHIAAEGVDTVAVCLLNSYANTAHEDRIAEIARSEFPELRLSLSSQILREFREYERTSTTVANAFVMRPITGHLTELEEELQRNSLQPRPYIMCANGGIMTFGAATEKPVALTHSGPMGGIVAATLLARGSGLSNVISFDMGGTSSDVSLIADGRAEMTAGATIAGLPVRLPSLELVTVGAGGGSIAWIDETGALKVGPVSAGARPGPACYGRGGTRPTVTDANLVLGRLNPDWFLAGQGKLHVELARTAIAGLAEQLGIGLIEAAFGIVRISEAHMVNAIKLASVKRGIDPRGFTLVGFGGAGPLHMLGLAQQLGIRRAISPVAPGNMSALGMLFADVRHDFVQSLVRDLSDIEPAEIREILLELARRGSAELHREGQSEKERTMLASADIRYRGQSHEINVPIGDWSEEGLRSLAEAFHARHRQVYGYHMPGDSVQLVNLRLTAIGNLTRADWVREPDPDLHGPQGKREVWLDPAGPVLVPVFRHEGLRAGETLAGPLIVEYTGSTLLVPPAWTLTCDEEGHLHLLRGEDSDG